jgi:hypothetical protein
MKLSTLFEMPYQLGQFQPPSISNIATPSDAGLERENHFLGELEQGEDRFRFWLSNDKGGATVTIKSKGAERNEIVLSVRFDNRAGVPVDNELQVHTVYNQPKFRNRNLAMAMYVLLARYGFTIVPDFEQFDGGKALWKKMATESLIRKFVIRIWSDALEDWLRDETGEIIIYNGENIDEFFIWNNSEHKKEPTSLLVLTSQ